MQPLKTCIRWKSDIFVLAVWKYFYTCRASLFVLYRYLKFFPPEEKIFASGSWYKNHVKKRENCRVVYTKNSNLYLYLSIVFKKTPKGSFLHDYCLMKNIFWAIGQKS